MLDVKNEGLSEVISGRVCMSCRGAGFPGGCPDCGKDTQQKDLIMQSVSIDVLKDYAIPPQYKTVEWDPDMLYGANGTAATRPEFKHYADLLTKCVENLRNGNLPEKSVLIVARRAMGKQTFAYCCMKEAIKHGMSTCQLVDTSQYRRLNILSTERPYLKVVTESKVSLEDIHNKDLVFVKVDPLSYMSSFKVIEAICDRRSRMGKPTIITSRFGPYDMAKLDYERDPMQLINRGNQTDRYKYPYLMWYTEEKK